ncbi:hypothetical protein ACJX0J_039512 [Zea mays]
MCIMIMKLSTFAQIKGYSIIIPYLYWVWWFHNTLVVSIITLISLIFYSMSRHLHKILVQLCINFGDTTYSFNLMFSHFQSVLAIIEKYSAARKIDSLWIYILTTNIAYLYSLIMILVNLEKR